LREDYLENNQTQISRVSIAQAIATDIQKKIADFEAEIAKTEAEIEGANDLLHGGWRTNAKDPAQMERVAEDIERLHRRKKMTEALRDGAASELEAVQRQIIADQILSVRAEVDRLMAMRTATARNITAVCFQLAAMIKEVNMVGEQVKQLFKHDRMESGLTGNEVGAMVNRDVRLHWLVSEILEQQLPPELWPAERPVFGFRDNLEIKLSDAIDGERRSLLASMDLRLEQFAAGAKEEQSHV
jgi:uncharacterized coiled-coil protein SlyX